MDILTSAADAVFNSGADDGVSGHLTPSKMSRGAFTERSQGFSASPEEYSSTLQALLTAPTLNTPNTKRKSSTTTLPLTPSSCSVGRGGGGNKTLLHPSPVSETLSPGREGGQGRSPITPMCNLKLLTHIASMEENVTSKKVLFEKDDNTVALKSQLRHTRPQQMSKLRRYKSDSLSQRQASNELRTATKVPLRKHPSHGDYTQPSSPDSLVTVGVGHLPPLEETTTRSSEGSRKDKSLGVLSEKFLDSFPMEVSFLETPRRLVIDEVATVLGTERRRVYDIINVLESLNMAQRVQKNMYQWMGKLHLEETLGRLKALGFKLNLKAQVEALQFVDLQRKFKFPQRVKTGFSADGEKVDSRREKSLGILCQKFLMLLLVIPEPQVLSMDHALKILMGESGEDTDRLRTRGRRLYDIANVLTSLGLVQRVPLAKGFQYIGPVVDAIASEEDSGNVRHRHSLLPSRLWVGESGGKENVACIGDHDVTPSAVPPPVQKRGRPRKLATDFSASTIPVAKRSRLQRTRSEDITTGKQSRKITRNPSLHDICQVAEVERNKLLQKEEQQQQEQSPSTTQPTQPAAKKDETPVTKLGLLSMSPAPATSLTALLHQKHFATRPKIPVALTFQKSKENTAREGIRIRSSSVVQKCSTDSGLASEISSSQILRPLQHTQVQQETNKTHPSSTTVFKASHSVTNQAQPINKILYSSWKPAVPAAPVMVAKESHAITRPVIRVVANMGGGINQQEPPETITVLSTRPAYNPSTSAPRQFVVQAGGGFQRLSQGHGAIGEGREGSLTQAAEDLTKFGQSNTSPFQVYTVSRSQMSVFPASKATSVMCDKYSSSPGVQPASPSEHTSAPRLSVPHAGPDNLYLNRPSVVISGMYGHQVANSFANTSPSTFPGPLCEQTRSGWQSSPDGSSTDSELEEIFGDSFRFARPKNLLAGNSSQDGAPSVML